MIFIIICFHVFLSNIVSPFLRHRCRCDSCSEEQLNPNGPFGKERLCLPSSANTGIWSVQTRLAAIQEHRDWWTALRGIDETNETACKALAVLPTMPTHLTQSVDFVFIRVAPSLFPRGSHWTVTLTEGWGYSTRDGWTGNRSQALTATLPTWLGQFNL